METLPQQIDEHLILCKKTLKKVSSDQNYLKRIPQKTIWASGFTANN